MEKNWDKLLCVIKFKRGRKYPQIANKDANYSINYSISNLFTEDIQI